MKKYNFQQRNNIETSSCSFKSYSKSQVTVSASLGQGSTWISGSNSSWSVLLVLIFHTL